MKRQAWLFALLLLLALPAAAQSVRGYASIQLDLHAGPDIGYPVVDLIPLGAPLYVHGCTANWAWCDVSVYDERGWVAGDYIDYPYQRRWVSVYSYGALIGIPVVNFIIGDYWHDHYRYRPFYHNRGYWYRHRFAYHPVPRYPRHRVRFAHAFHDQARYGYGYRRDHDRRYDHDRRRDDQHRSHGDHRDRDRDRGHGNRVNVRIGNGNRQRGHERGLGQTVARHAIPRNERRDTYHPPQNASRRLAGRHPATGNQRFAARGGNWQNGRSNYSRPAQAHRQGSQKHAANRNHGHHGDRNPKHYRGQH